MFSRLGDIMIDTAGSRTNSDRFRWIVPWLSERSSVQSHGCYIESGEPSGEAFSRKNLLDSV